MFVRKVEVYDVAGTPSLVDADASERRPSHTPRHRVHRAAFVPLKTAKRFIVFQSPYSVRFSLREAVGLLRSTIPHSKRALAAYVKRLEAMPLPTSLLSVSPHRVLFGEEQIQREPTTRGEAIELAAELNANAVRKHGAAIKGPEQVWATIFELGRPFPGLVAASMDEGSIGTLWRSSHCPIRVVEPTEEEQARYPIDWSKTTGKRKPR
jgi:hypothetical protein